MDRNEVIETAYELIRDSAEACINTDNNKGYVDFVDGVTSMTEAILDKLKCSMTTELNETKENEYINETLRSER